MYSRCKQVHAAAHCYSSPGVAYSWSGKMLRSDPEYFGSLKNIPKEREHDLALLHGSVRWKSYMICVVRSAQIFKDFCLYM